MFSQDFGKMLIYLGAILVIVGLLVHFGGKWFSLGRLPGDLKWENGGFGIYFPVVSCIIISIILTIVLNLFGRR